MAVTEAGLLPLYSEWKAVDVYGLNDQWIARHGGVTPDYLDRYQPDVLMMHENTWPDSDRHWQTMIDTMKAHASELIDACRPRPYIWWLDGLPINSEANTD